MPRMDYSASIQRLVEIAENIELSESDTRHLHRVKNYLRERQSQKSVVTPSKVNPQNSFRNHRGITI